MVKHLLNVLIGDRDVEEMSCTEARELVKNFYLILEVTTIGQRRSKAKLEFLAKQALESVGLEYFA